MLEGLQRLLVLAADGDAEEGAEREMAERLREQRQLLAEIPQIVLRVRRGRKRRSTVWPQSSMKATSRAGSAWLDSSANTWRSTDFSLASRFRNTEKSAAQV